MESSQREYVLRQQLKAIQEELGEKDPAEAEVDELREQLAEIELPEDVRKQADRELSRLEKLPQAAAEHGVIRTYLEWIASLPWDKRTDDNLDLAHARECSTRTTTASRRSRSGSSSSSRCASSSRTPAAPDPLLRRPARAWARRRWAARSRARWAASSSASRAAACATRPRSAATAAPTSARCRARSSARCATRAPTTRCS